ncbi:MAG: AAA family ATPase [Nanoarchaeota archaeon]
MWKFPHYEIGHPIPWNKLEQEFDWFRDMRGVPQDPIWHAEGDVFIHTKMVAEALVSHPDFQNLSEQDKHIMFAVAMLHDVEKRSTTEHEEIDGKIRITSRAHAKKGEKTARVILYKDISTPFKIREHICKLVRHHGLPIWAIEKENPSKEVIAASLKLDTKMLSLFAKSDIIGRIAEDNDAMMEKVAFFEELCKENDCFGKSRQFASDLGRRYYFQREEAHPDYEPFDEKNFTVYVMCAVPGSGKDTFIKNNLSNIPMVSLDEIRVKNKVKRGDTKGEGRAIQEAKELSKVYMRVRQDFVYNATNITKEMRSKVISEFEDYGAKVEVIYIEVPYKELLQQNHNREYKVPESAVENMIGSLEMPDITECYKVQYCVKE